VCSGFFEFFFGEPSVFSLVFLRENESFEPFFRFPFLDSPRSSVDLRLHNLATIGIFLSSRSAVKADAFHC
jgi:hypothetical protein